MSNLIVVGAGELGCRVAQMWKGLFPQATVYLAAKTENEERERRWISLGYQPLQAGQKAPCVLFCAPPSGK